MDPAPLHSARRLACKPSIVLMLVCLVFAACSTPAQNNKILFEDSRGTVSLQRTSDQSIQATHPLTLDPALLATILKGMAVQDQERGIQRLVAGPPAPVPVFSDDQIQFLAPLLAQGLRAAAPDEFVAYQVQTTHPGSMLESSTTETTAGSLYAFGRQLCLILSQYRSSTIRANMNVNDTAYRMRPPDYSGLRNHILLFTPSAAQRPDAFDPPAEGKSTDKFLAIDYQLLQQTPPTAAISEQSAPQMGQTTPIRESPIGGSASEAPAHTTEALAQEVETLRKELQSVQERLNDQTIRQGSQKRKNTPPSKPQHTPP